MELTRALRFSAPPAILRSVARSKARSCGARRMRVVVAASSEKSNVQYVLIPIGSGDTAHLETPVPMPGPFTLGVLALLLN